MVCYKPISSLNGPRFTGIKTFMRLPNIQTTKDVDFAIIGIPFDTASTFRTGSRFAPAAIRDMSVTIRSYHSGFGLNIPDILSGVDLGDINIVPGYIEESYEKIEQGMQPIVDDNVIPISIGGDHSITLAELRAVAKKHGPVALVQFDAHMDTIDSYLGEKYSHATSFRRAWEEGLIDTSHSIQVGIRSNFKTFKDIGFKVITADMIREQGLESVGKQIRERVGEKKAFLTFDIDFVDPAYAPGTGTMEVCGFTSSETLYLLRETKKINFVGFDLVEVIPAYDPNQITSFLAANIIQEFLGLIALNKVHSKKEELEI
ncbi:agmatinase [Aminipila terrae]|uniref:Agmatinase n=1 Tax=Aminipila terrae TaxID=2697030 RepID=A0A6P1MHE7_9FIRM|nr:agmatinase [Aminipila terrae]QHI71438.1 agmatinase [Aminipila terrae]